MFDAIISKLATKLLHNLSPEAAHNIALIMLEAGFYLSAEKSDTRLSTQCFGRSLPNPIGLAAGFDKDCRAARVLSNLGFGFVECGTVTPRPQPGNPLPRLFRLSEDAAIINRMGFNSDGAAAFTRRLQRLRAREVNRKRPAIIGVNLGINKEDAQPDRDYAALATRFSPLADYLTINLSSPNTPGLRALQGAESIAKILQAIRSATPLHPPLMVKLAPDLTDAELPTIIEACVAHGAAGIIVSNTTVTRPSNLTSQHRHESGGLSGRPLSELSMMKLKRAVALANGKLTIISAGGIETGCDVFERLRIGADLVQIYTAFIYEGPALLQRIQSELLREMTRNGCATLSDIKKA